jgi:predicted Zn-dependent protease with MMP-like domain
VEVGLLWYDSDPQRELEDKIGRAAERYREKFGRWPNTCFVHPRAIQNCAEQESGVACQLQTPKTMIRVVSAPYILLHHFWLGISNDNVANQREKALN